MSEVLVDVKNLKKYFPTGEKGKTVKAAMTMQAGYIKNI